MSDPKFTPGPWDTYHIDDHGLWCIVKKVNGTTIDPTTANARLISAAPDMYEALKLALSFIDNSEHATGVERDAYGLIEMAIAKAEGKE